MILGSIHKSHVVHSPSRNYTCKAGMLCVIDGVGHYIEKLWKIEFTVSLHQIYVMWARPLHKIAPRELFGIRLICRLHFGRNFPNFPSFIVKNGPEKWTQERAKHAFFVVLKTSSFPPKRVKSVASIRKSRQQTGLKAILYMIILTGGGGGLAAIPRACCLETGAHACK